MNDLVYVDIDQGIHKGKMKVALSEKRKKLRGFSFSINIANFEAFLSVFKLTKNPLFLKSDCTSEKNVHFRSLPQKEYPQCFIRHLRIEPIFSLLKISYYVNYFFHF